MMPDNNERQYHSKSEKKRIEALVNAEAEPVFQVTDQHVRAFADILMRHYGWSYHGLQNYYDERAARGITVCNLPTGLRKAGAEFLREIADELEKMD